jgi:hypothetical protein
MRTMSIEPGTMIQIIDVEGRKYPARALSGIEVEGHGFPVVWVERPLADGGTDRVPWPADSIATE